MFPRNYGNRAFFFTRWLLVSFGVETPSVSWEILTKVVLNRLAAEIIARHSNPYRLFPVGFLWNNMRDYCVARFFFILTVEGPTLEKIFSWKNRIPEASWVEQKDSPNTLLVGLHLSVSNSQTSWPKFIPTTYLPILESVLYCWSNFFHDTPHVDQSKIWKPPLLKCT